MMIMPLVIMAMPLGYDRDFMTELYDRHKGLMFKTAWEYSKQPVEADDIVSDACVALIKGISTLRELEEDRLRAYIVVTVKHKAFDYMNQRKS